MTSDAEADSPRGESLFDFLYLDRARLASYLAQLFDDGALTHIKKTASKGTSMQGGAEAGLLGVAKGSMGGSGTTQEAIERQFDASWSAPLDLMRELNDRGFVSGFGPHVQIGQIVLFRGSIQLLDMRIMQQLWQPVMAMQAADMPTHTEAQRKVKKAAEAHGQQMARVIERFPHIIQLRAFDRAASLWATLDPSALTINASDLLFKFGPSIPGEWAMLAVLDAKPWAEHDEMVFPPGLGEVETGMLTMAFELRKLFGRNFGDYGVTPLAIYRAIPAGAI